MMFKIDFVLPWVNGNDPEWIALFNQYSSVKKTVLEDDYLSQKRYEDIGLLRYWFRCVERNASWVNKVFFITNGQKPDWLNTDCEKLVWIRHNDYIPAEYLPVFSANPIELNLHRIEALSDHFVYFNDDFFLINRVDRSYFFNNDGLPCDFAILDKIPAGHFGHIIINNVSEINARFNKNDVIGKNKNKWFNLKYGKDLLRTLFFNQAAVFSGFMVTHTSQAFLKSTFDEVWKNCDKVLSETSSNKFRSAGDVSQYLFRYWQLVTGKFSPVSPKGRVHFDTNIAVTELEKYFINNKIKEICINDGYYHEEAVKLFDKYYPEKSMFEL